ncbi:hypothetical protein RF11_07772 [Thelohanellus kitauei]|uniref:Uncharacterized protein n=1 Tax=Thelohanellus kitauei TaxID=669202 RepID=A0A0C2IP36_THEKT|nr:hypothetical protein RF11_07772 [Thelohanellus kitauei]
MFGDLRKLKYSAMLGRSVYRQSSEADYELFDECCFKSVNYNTANKRRNNKDNRLFTFSTSWPSIRKAGYMQLDYICFASWNLNSRQLSGSLFYDYDIPCLPIDNIWSNLKPSDARIRIRHSFHDVCDKLKDNQNYSIKTVFNSMN